MAGTLDRDRHLTLDPGRVAGASPGKNLAPVVEAAPQPGDVLVIDDLVIVENRLLLPAGRAPPAATGPPAPTAAASLTVSTAKAATATTRAASRAARAARAAGTAGTTRAARSAGPAWSAWSAKSGAWLLAAVSFLVAGIRHSGFGSRLRRLVTANNGGIGLAAQNAE